MYSEALQRIKTMLNITNQDSLIEEIFYITTQKILSIISEDVVPTELEWIIIELTIERFNRIGSEGISTESVDGKQISYNDNDIDKFMPYINNYIYKNNIKRNDGWRLF